MEKTPWHSPRHVAHKARTPAQALLEFPMVKVRASQVDIDAAVQALRDGDLVAFRLKRSMAWAPMRQSRGSAQNSKPRVARRITR